MPGMRPGGRSGRGRVRWPGMTEDEMPSGSPPEGILQFPAQLLYCAVDGRGPARADFLTAPASAQTSGRVRRPVCRAAVPASQRHAIPTTCVRVNAQTRQPPAVDALAIVLATFLKPKRSVGQRGNGYGQRGEVAGQQAGIGLGEATRK